MKVGEFSKGNGRKTEDMEKDLKDIVTAILMKEISKAEKLTVMAYIDGEMEKFMKVNGSME